MPVMSAMPHEPMESIEPGRFCATASTSRAGASQNSGVACRSPGIHVAYMLWAKATIVNLCQDPKCRPVLSDNLPCLLRGGLMWMDSAPLTAASDEGRMMTATEKMNSLGVGMYPPYCESCGFRFPIFGTHQFGDAALSTEAGNGMNILSIGGCTFQAMCFLQTSICHVHAQPCGQHQGAPDDFSKCKEACHEFKASHSHAFVVSSIAYVPPSPS